MLFLDIPLSPFNITIKTDRNDVSELLSKVLLAASTQQSSQYIILKDQVVIFFIHCFVSF